MRAEMWTRPCGWYKGVDGVTEQMEKASYTVDINHSAWILICTSVVLTKRAKLLTVY